MDAIDQIQSDEIIDIGTLPEFENLNDDSILSGLEQNQEAIESELSELLTKLDEEPPKGIEVSSLGDKVIETVIDGILGPFGLSRAVFMDKDGGAVTTSFNAKKGIYALEKEEYDRINDYDPGFRKTKQIALDRARNADGGFTDEYTGLYTDRPDVDHIVADESYHRLYGGWMQDKEQRKAFSADPDNHAVTDRSVNRSMQEKDIKKWENSPNSHDPSVTNKEYYALDDRRVNARIKRGEKVAKAHQPTSKEVFKYQASALGKAGVKTGLALAMRQSVGVMLKVFVETAYSAIKEAISKWKEKVITTVKEFLSFIVNKLKSLKDSFKDILKQVGAAAAQGLSAGFLSTLVTFLINTFITTAARVVTIIREAFNTITKTIKTLCDSKADKKERVKAACNIFITGMATCLGILLLEAVKNWLLTVPVLQNFADDAAHVIVNIITGLIGVIAFYIAAKLSARKAKKEQALAIQENLDRIFSLEQWRIVNSTQLATVQVVNTAQALFQTMSSYERALADWNYLLRIQEFYDQQTDENLDKDDIVQRRTTVKIQVMREKSKKRRQGNGE